MEIKKIMNFNQEYNLNESQKEAMDNVMKLFEGFDEKTTEEIAEETKERITEELVEEITQNHEENLTKKTTTNNKEIDFSKITKFRDNPFKEYNNEKLEELAESIKDDGLLSPIILWKENEEVERYTILSGHNRFLALQKLGYDKLKCNMYKIVENISFDEARLIVADANLNQRTKLLPSERAKAYKIQQEVLKNKGSIRSEIFTFFEEENAVNASEQEEYMNLCHDDTNNSKRSIYRYLRLNFLIPELLEKVDDTTISLILGVEISYLKEDEQREVLKYFLQENKAKLNIEMCKKIRTMAGKMPITKDVLELIVESVLKHKNKRTFKVNFKEIRELTKEKLTTDKEAKDYIIKCIKFYEENTESKNEI